MFKEGLILIGLIGTVSCKTEFSDEPKCSSRFDFEYNMVQKMVRLEEKLNKLEQMLSHKDSIIEKMSTDGVGTVYVRWGRNVCPRDAILIYTGYVGGKIHSDKGSGSDSVCLPHDPSWYNYTDGVNEWRAHIYGTETDIDTPNIFPYPIHNQDMPCAVCRTLKSAVLMIPGRTTCYSGLQQEYTGYLMSAYHNHHGPHNHLCVDGYPEFIPNGSRDDSQHILYLVESMCGSLPCPPYVQGRELACVVCSV